MEVFIWCLDSIKNWMMTCKLKLNPDKMEVRLAFLLEQLRQSPVVIATRWTNDRAVVMTAHFAALSPLCTLACWACTDWLFTWAVTACFEPWVAGAFAFENAFWVLSAAFGAGQFHVRQDIFVQALKKYAPNTWKKMEESSGTKTLGNLWVESCLSWVALKEWKHIFVN